MTTDIKAPQFPESISEGTIATWHKKVGDAVSEGETLLEIETDKVLMEVPAVSNGVLMAITKKEGDTVKSMEIIGQLEAGAAPAAISAPEVKAAPIIAEAAAGPAARRVMQANDVDPKAVEGSGKHGRITTQDVSKVLGSTGLRTEKRVPMTRLRQTIAKRLLEVQQNTAMLTTFNEVNMKPIMDLRTKYKDQFEKTHGAKLGFMSFFIKAVTEALKRFPSVNASIDGNDIIYHGYYDVGVAVSTDRGLVVPVLRNTENMSLADIESGIAEYALKARNNKIELADMQGGTFTVTNGGVFGSMMSTPIINAPQSAILGMHNIIERPIALNGEVVIRPMMYIALSYDHRIIDGRESVSFLKTVKELLEDPARILLAV
ncbi:MAG: 2-oxoglutarate dehydrogenase complex dihydrolipoyllysine-residue succinyltransferase [Gammaproteobacteria bacterium]|nr:2-oxoglutarate dehydrogenase complex dihydrolipoyllysine-residue succinyltransferase [Gammaproteobacteria bacterium]